ncbi:NAD(P)H-dependent flavin oxidoreductase [Paracoccus endophyticus]|uniref:NAD(P)H-dependent flavin oxidoreductase n=1 Tax=Paracoccus endophyticus TaxID=2233774 RepID=UPI000DD6CDBE|nr:nitronate monooxygenase [Paracoccus endophyticus]
MTDLIAALDLRCPVFQAPMAGTSTPALAAAVSNAGGLGNLGLGAMTAAQAAQAMADTAALTDRAWGVNLFCHRPPVRDSAREAAWLDRLAPHFARFGARPPATLREIYVSFPQDDAMLAAVVAARPRLVSVHFGLPRPDQIAALRATGAVLAATATSPAEARAIADAGLDAIVAQGWQAGGHRGIFDPDEAEEADERLDTLELVARLVPLGLPVIAAGGIMQASDSRAALAAGAVAVQCGTAFLRAPEAATPQAHRDALAAGKTVMTAAISGRPARCCVNDFTRIGGRGAGYPMTYDAGKALNAAALAAGHGGYGPHWAGTGAAQAVARPAAETLAALRP